MPDGPGRQAIREERAGHLVDSLAALALLADGAPDAIFHLGLGGDVRYANRRALAAMGASSVAELADRSWTERWRAEDRAALASALESARRGTAARLTVASAEGSGERRCWDMTLSPVGEYGPAGVLVIARETSEAGDAVAAELRHRLKNAFTVAGALVTMAARDQPEQQGFAREIVDRFARMAAVQAFVLEPGSDKRFIDLVPLLAQAYGPAARLEFGSLPDVSLGEEAMQALALVFGELCTNSLKYGALKHGRAIRLSGTANDRACELRWREETDFAGLRDGGQGLYLARRIVRSAGGELELASVDGELRVTMRLPVADPATTPG